MSAPRGYAESGCRPGCHPAPAMALAAADALVSEWFLARYGSGEVIRKIYDPGTGHAAQIAELEALRTRLREEPPDQLCGRRR